MDTMSILDGKYFKIKHKMDKNKVIATCIICELNCVELRVSLSKFENYSNNYV